MLIKNRCISGFTLIELLVFITISSIIITTLALVYRYSLTTTNQLIINSQRQSLAKSQIENIISRKYDESSNVDNKPCGITTNCTTIGLDYNESFDRIGTLDDIDDFNGYEDRPETGVIRRVEVSFIGEALGIKHTHAKRIRVSVSSSNQKTVIFSVIRVNH
jgi:MSHA pilin protein MshD